jgi:hypothetical protein
MSKEGKYEKILKSGGIRGLSVLDFCFDFSEDDHR